MHYCKLSNVSLDFSHRPNEDRRHVLGNKAYTSEALYANVGNSEPRTEPSAEPDRFSVTDLNVRLVIFKLICIG